MSSNTDKFIFMISKILILNKCYYYQSIYTRDMELRVNNHDKSDQFQKARQIARDYLNIQENTEYLTNMVRFRQGVIKTYHQQKPIVYSLKSMASLTIQISYFLFTCFVKRVNVYLSKTFFHQGLRSKNGYGQICCKYMLQTDFLRLSVRQQQLHRRFFLRHEFSSTKSIMFGKYVLSYVNYILSIAKNQQQAIETVKDKEIYGQFLELEQLIRNHIEPKLQNILSPRIIILCFQESSLFRQHSMLVKILNNSIFSQIRNSPNQSILNDILSGEKTAETLRNTKDKLESIKQMEDLLEDTISYLIRKKVINAVKSIHGLQALKTNSSKNYVGSIKEGLSSNDRKYICEINIHQKPFNSFNHQTYEMLKREVEGIVKSASNEQHSLQKKERNINQYIIEYHEYKSMLCVKYITSIEITRQTADLIMFQCNSITATCYHIEAQIIEQQPSRSHGNPESSKKTPNKKQKYLALNAWVYLNISNEPIMKLLLIIDLVMICAKVTESSLQRKQEQSNFQLQMPLIMDHTVKLFINKMEKYYRMMLSTSKKQQ